MSAVQQAVRAATNWSSYQSDLFDWAANGSGNIIVQAVAGSGKTTTGVEMVKRMRGSHIYLAFNKSIATELSSRGVNGRTFHSLCYGPVLKFKGATSVDSNKLQTLAREIFDDSTRRAYGTFTTKLVGLARNAGIGAGLLPNVPSEWEALANHHDLEPDTDNGDMDEGITLAMELLAASNDSPMVDFDDLLYITVKDNLTLPKFDNVLVDETQDTNAIQRAIVKKIMHTRSRLGAVGDEAQAIYGFRGADSDSMGLIADEFNCKQMPLTVTYRCPKAVVAYAQQWVDHIEAAPDAIDGAVTELANWTTKSFTPGDLVVCRTTKPLVSLAYKLIRDRIPARVMGREIGQGLRKLVERMRAHGVDALIEKLQAYTAREVSKALAKEDESKAAAVRDKTDCIMCLIEGLDEINRTIPALIAAIEQIFSDANSVGVTLATIHKAKGLEANRVFWLNRSKCPSPWARQDWQQQQEANLCYVAATRAKLELVLIEEGDRA
jgi:DNA helicase-2/ATP-dependent DNA helicase PcrA